jgi:hypothetical protein
MAMVSAAASNAMAESGADACGRTARWSAATRVAFRFWCVLLAICVLPRSMQTANLRTWQPIVNTVGAWPITHVLHLPPHSWAPIWEGGDSLPDVLAAGVLAACSLLIAAIWSLLDRHRPAYPRLSAWVYTTTRFVLAGLLLFYGWDKILPGQFGPSVNIEKAMQPAFQLTPMALLWTFIGASRSYTAFAGVVEFSGGVLLLMRRTALFGALIAAAAMANVLMLNVAYDVGVKLLSGEMLLMALVLIAPHATRLGQFFFLNRSTALAQPPALFTDVRWDRAARVAGMVAALSVVYWSHALAQGVVQSVAAAALSPFDGAWIVETTVRDGVPVQSLATDDTLWKRVVFAGSGAAFTFSLSDSEAGYRLRINRNAGTLDFLPPPPAPPGAARIASYGFSFPDRDHLELRTSPDAGGTTVRLRREDPSAWPLMAHRHRWTW